MPKEDIQIDPGYNTLNTKLISSPTEPVYSTIITIKVHTCSLGSLYALQAQ